MQLIDVLSPGQQIWRELRDRDTLTQTTLQGVRSRAIEYPNPRSRDIGQGTACAVEC